MTIACIAFVFIFCGALVGLLLRAALPDHHTTGEARDTVKLGTGLIATLAAMVLGLLVSSAKGTLDAMNTELMQTGAKIIMLDRVLAKYGPESKDVREKLRGSVAGTINRIWPEDKSKNVSLRAIETSSALEQFQDKLAGLSPRSDIQRQLQSQAQQIATEIAQSRWILIEQTQQALPTAFLVVLVFWLTILFAGFGLQSPGNATVIAVLFVCAVSVSGAVFLILEMNTPLTGIIKVSSAPLQKALENIGR